MDDDWKMAEVDRRLNFIEIGKFDYVLSVAVDEMKEMEKLKEIKQTEQLHVDRVKKCDPKIHGCMENILFNGILMCNTDWNDHKYHEWHRNDAVYTLVRMSALNGFLISSPLYFSWDFHLPRFQMKHETDRK